MIKDMYLNEIYVFQAESGLPQGPANGPCWTNPHDLRIASDHIPRHQAGQGGEIVGCQGRLSNDEETAKRTVVYVVKG